MHFKVMLFSPKYSFLTYFIFFKLNAFTLRPQTNLAVTFTNYAL